MNAVDIATVFEDEALIIVAKPPGLTAEEAGHRLSQGRKKELILLHRLDKDTTGLLILAKRKDAAGEMSRAFEEKRVRKTYLAVVEGIWGRELQRAESYISQAASGRWQSRAEGPGKRALTTFRRLSTAPGKSLIEALPKTGRTHQIRLHCAGLGHPILGDRLYHPRPQGEGPTQALHAHRIDFRHPLDGRPLRITTPPPAFWRATWLEGFDLEPKLESLLTGENQDDLN